MAETECTQSEFHGNPFRYCPCGWIEETKPDPDAFLKKAKESVLKSADYLESWKPDDLYIVWFVKALGNWKALVSTDELSGTYWEVTYNGAKNETYVDTYNKMSNVAIAD